MYGHKLNLESPVSGSLYITFPLYYWDIKTDFLIDTRNIKSSFLKNNNKKNR